MELLNFSNNYFDIVYSISAIGHVPANIRRQIWKKTSLWMIKEDS